MWCSAADKHLKQLDRAVNVACFLTGGVLDCDLTHRRSFCSIMYAVQDQMLSEAPTLWYSAGGLCASEGCTWCFGRTSIYLCTSSLQNLTVLQDLYSPLSVSLE